MSSNEESLLKEKFRFAIDRGGTFTDVYSECPNGEVRDPATNTCRQEQSEECGTNQFLNASGECENITQTQCEDIPTCTTGQILVESGTQDGCGFEILQCADETFLEEPCPTGQALNHVGVCEDKLPDVVEPNPTGGCDTGYTLNTFGFCQLIGSGGNSGGDGKGGSSGDVNFCSGENFNIAQCFSQVFNGGEGGAPSFTLSGTNAQIIAGVVIISLIVIVIAIIVRLRRGGGISL